MQKNMRKMLALLLAVLLLLTALPIGTLATEVTGGTDATEENTTENTTSLSRVTVKIETEKKVYSTQEKVAFHITVANNGLKAVEDIYLLNRSNKHLNLDNDQRTIIIGTIPAGESRTVTLQASYWEELNTTTTALLIMRTITPVYETLFTLYANILLPLFNKRSATSVVHFEEVDRDYCVVSILKSGAAPEVPTTEPSEQPTEPPTEPTTEPPTEPPTEQPTEPPTEPDVELLIEINQADYTSTENEAALSGTFFCENLDNIQYSVAPFSYEVGSSTTGEVVLDANTWECTIPLKPGNNEITFTLSDTAGNTKTDSITVTYTIGEPYVYTETDISVDEENNISYINNIISIYFADNTPIDEINEVIRSIGGEQVGVNYALDCYQVRVQKTDIAGLMEVIAQVEEYDSVIFADYDTLHDMSNVAVNDPWGGDVSTEDWLNDSVDGSNWGLEAIEAAGAWVYNDRFSFINIGVVDNGFTTTHPDLALNIISRQNNVDTKCDHGTHVSGIIGATADNRVGLTGIMHNHHNLLCFDVGGFSDAEIYQGLTTAVVSGAKIINFSMGCPSTLSSDAIRREGMRASFAMAKLLADYDFLVVQSAGNSSLDAINNGLFSSVTAANCQATDGVTVSDIMNRIIIVAAAEQTGEGSYRMTDFSSGGSQVSIAAPGRNIYSTVLDSYESWDGTSMAAPMVSSVAALVWSINSEFSGATVKDIVCSSTNTDVADNPISNLAVGSERMVNARLAVEEALQRVDGKGSMKVRFLDSVTGLAIPKVTITCTAYEGYADEDPVGTIVYNEDTLFSVELPAGKYIYKVTHPEYIDRFITLDIIAGTVTNLGDITLSKGVNDDQVQIYLNWGATPSDLDSHFTGITNSGARKHVFFSQMGDSSAWLDVDDTSSYGPETITINLAQFESFTYSIHNYSNKSATSESASALNLATSGANIKVVRGDTVIATYEIPDNRKGTVWNVFEMSASGVITDLNSFEFIDSPGSVGSTIS